MTGPGEVGVAGASLTLARAGSSRSASSAGDGGFRFTSVETGSWTLAVSPPAGFVLATGESASRGVTVGAGTVSVPIRLAASGPPASTGSIAGTVRHAGGGVGAVTLALAGPGGASLTRQTSADGTFEATGLAVGSWTVAITPPSYFRLASGEDASRTITVAAGQTSPLTVTLAPASAVGTTEVTLEALAFAPADVTVPPGTTIRWRNGLAIFHTISPDGHAAWTDRSVSGAGETTTAVLNNPGTYAYFCQPHRSQGMTGIIRVVAP